MNYNSEINNNVYYMIEKKDNINLKSDTMKARHTLKLILDYLNISMDEIITSKNGKPYFKNLNVFFNYSHSKSFIACAISFCEVGIDIEDSNRIINDDIAKKYLDNVKGNKNRLKSWVRKESYSKLKGLGLQMKFQDINLNEIKNKNYLIDNKDYICSIYCENNNVNFINIIC